MQTSVDSRPAPATSPQARARSLPAPSGPGLGAAAPHHHPLDAGALLHATPTQILALQRAAGNQAVSSLLEVGRPKEPPPSIPAPRDLSIQRAADPEFSPTEATQLRTKITTGRNAAQAFSDKFTQFLDNAGKFITAYRGKCTWVNGAYTLGYGHHVELVGQLGAAAETDQTIANLAVGLALNVLTGGVAEILEAMEVIGHATAFWGDQLVNTVAGVAAAPQIPSPTTTATSAPAFTQLKGLQKLDELNQFAFQLATDGSRQVLKMVFEAGALSDALVAPDGDPAHIEGKVFDTRMAALDKSFEQIPAAASKVDAGNAKFDVLWQTFFQSPWPDDRRSEQDIWIIWMSEQKTYDNPDMPKNDGFLGMLDEAITPQLLRSRKFQDHMMAIGGDAAVVASHSLDTMIKFAAEGRKPRIAKFWASVFME